MTNNHHNFAPQEYWDDAYSDQALKVPRRSDALAQFIKKYFPPSTKSVFEIGCFPGSYLSVFGQRGYELNGMDLTPRVTSDLPRWFKAKGYQVGSFSREDFFKFSPTTQYDVVCSFGFIEHFSDFLAVIDRHVPLVKPGGYLLITTPNFSGSIQKWLHMWLDRANVERHHLPAMDPRVWQKHLEKQGFSAIYSGWFGGFRFWVEPEQRNWFKKILIKIIRLKSFVSAYLPIPNHPSYSPFCGLIMKRND